MYLFKNNRFPNAFQMLDKYDYYLIRSKSSSLFRCCMPVSGCITYAISV